MNKVPSLITLCIGSIKDAILDEENGNLHHVYVLPPELFNQIIPNLPSLALQNLQDAKSFVSSNEDCSSDDCLRPSKRQKRFENFDSAWKELYKLRWNEAQHDKSTPNWQPIYWEKHLQNCLDAIAETVSITLFDGFLGEVEIPDTLLQCISYGGHLSRSKSCSKLTYHCERFGIYARRLRLQSVHCVAEIGNILKTSRLEHLEVNWLKSKEQVDGLCKLLDQNKETLASVDLVHCKLPATLVSAICDSLHVKGYETNVIKTFSIKRSSFLDSSSFPLPLGLESLLIAATNLTSLILSDNHIWWKTAKLIFDTLLEAESGLQVLDLSENNISGWLSHFKWRSPNCINPGLQTIKCLNSLRVLNLRANGLQKHDVDCLKYAMVYMPNLKVLNLSENSLENDGIMMLVPYLIEKSKSETPLDELYLENCDISRANQLLPALASFTVPLKFLSLGENPFFCLANDEYYGTYLGRFLCSGIQAVNVKATRLGSNGFAAAEREITQKMSRLVSIDISCNDGRIGTASFLSKLISMAPNLISLNASNNWIPVESVPTICSCIKAANGKLEHLDLRQNPLCNKTGIASLLAEFQVNGKPNILLSSPTFTPYDQDP
ncbi:uncharacterized protein [Rutidosis leptorrhynchoides]|uniref:uncharacterized protein n=1 Tax=Rutidosis leptorrhynchoides TaxID=125765 RepID=UPI003A9A1AA0